MVVVVGSHKPQVLAQTSRTEATTPLIMCGEEGKKEEGQEGGKRQEERAHHPWNHSTRDAYHMYAGRGWVGLSVAHRCVMARKYVSDLDSDVVGGVVGEGM